MDLWNNHIGRQIGRQLKEKGITDDELYIKEIINVRDKLKVIK